jgi:hypothetical protein|nr:MAG TPA: hypothetical protein [Caudoviricetes sp.]
MKMRYRRFQTRAKVLFQMWRPKKVDAEAEIAAGRLDPRAMILLKALGERAHFVLNGSMIRGRKEVRLASFAR